MKSGAFLTCVVGIGLGLIDGCGSGVPDEWTSGLGGEEGFGGAGGEEGLGGAGGVSAKLGWCAAESIDVGETRSPTEMDMAVAANGDVVVVWRENLGRMDVWSNHWTPGTGWGTAERIQTVEGPIFWRPRVAINTSGTVVAVWAQSDCMSSYDIWSRRWTPSEGWGTAERIDSEDGQAQYPEVAIDSSGNVISVWTQANGVGMQSTWSNRWTQDAGWGTPERIQSSDSWALDAQVAVDRDGNAIAAWRERNSEDIYELWLNRWTPDGGWGAPERSDATDSVGKFDVALDPSGHALAVWSAGAGQGFDRGIWAARWTGAWEPAEQVVDGRRTRDPKVAFDATGNATASWMYWAGADTGGARIWASRWTPDEGWGGLTQLHGVGSSGRCNEFEGLCTDGWAWDQQLAVDPNGSALVVWKESEHDADGQRLDIWSRRWTSGEGWGEAERVEHQDRAAESPQVGLDPTGTGIAVWSQGGLWSARFERGCGNANGAGGGGGEGGSGGVGGAGDLCEGVVCPDAECSSGGSCNPDNGTCSYAATAEDGATCSEGACLSGGCGRIGSFPCTEQGIRDAIAEGGGPHFFACDEQTPVVLTEELVIDNDVIFDGEGELILDGSAPPNAGTPVRIARERTVELRAIRAMAAPRTPAIHSSGILRLVESTVEGVYNYEGTLTITDTDVRRFGVMNYLGPATLTRTRISAEWSYGDGAGITNSGGMMTVRDSTITGSGFGDSPSFAGGVYNSHSFSAQGEFNDGVLHIEDTMISDNTGRYAGAIYNNGGTVTLTNTTVSGNIAERGPSIYSWTWRGGTMTLTNSTVSGGSVLYECGSDANGYGIGNHGTLIMTNSTVAANAFSGLDNRGEAMVTNSVIDGGCIQFGDDAVTVSGGHNIVGGTDACGFNESTDLVDVSASALALGPLAENGGPTMTHALLPGSVAIDAIPALMCEVAEDQRGEPRPAGGMCDVGAFEVQP
ncbi:MAG: choice-of-anchor Q domain-containing protein [Polyangiales bacterium]